MIDQPRARSLRSRPPKACGIELIALIVPELPITAPALVGGDDRRKFIGSCSCILPALAHDPAVGEVR
jgi:hypothetical protein